MVRGLKMNRIFVLLVVAAAPAAAQEPTVQILGGVEKTEVRAAGNADMFYRLDPGGPALRVRAVGPTFLVVRCRVQEGPFGKASGRVFVERDAEARSDNIFTVDNDKEAIALGRGLSLEKHLLFEVPQGEHGYLISAPAGATLVVAKVLKSPKKVVEWVAAPERPLPPPEKPRVAEPVPEEPPLELLATKKQGEPTLEPLAQKPAEQKPEAEKRPEPSEEKAPETEEETTPAVTPEDPGDEAPGRKPIWIMVAAHTGMLVPSGRLNDVKLAATDSLRDAAAGKLGLADNRGATLPFSVQGIYRLPFLRRAFGIGAEVGIYPLSGKGRRDLPNDPDFTSIAYRWDLVAVPIFIGASYRPPLPELFKWWPLKLRLAPEAGFAAVYSSFTAYYKVGGAEEIGEPAQGGWALGFYLGLEAGWPLGPGDIVANLRYVNARTDLGLPQIYADPPQPWNRGLGDVQGTNVLLGYRYLF
jgi:hypothetical protein